MEHAPPYRALWPTFVRNLGAFGALLFVLGSAAGTAGCGSDIGVTGPSSANPLDEGEEGLVKELNAHRESAGLQALTVCASLNVSATLHSDDMRSQGYQSDIGKDGSTTMSRACEAGYKPGCDGAAMAEVIASGSDDPASTLNQWKEDATAGPILINPNLVVLGVGRSFRNDKPPIWTVDLGGASDSSCE
jgi:uncharacterized protein YkwD